MTKKVRNLQNCKIGGVWKTQRKAASHRHGRFHRYGNLQKSGNLLHHIESQSAGLLRSPAVKAGIAQVKNLL